MLLLGMMSVAHLVVHLGLPHMHEKPLTFVYVAASELGQMEKTTLHAPRGMRENVQLKHPK